LDAAKRFNKITLVKKTETREETLERLAQDASSGKGAAKSFEQLVKRAAKTPSPTAQAVEPEPEDD
jgi:hypothetical protein